jgi:hypothetical protein
VNIQSELFGRIILKAGVKHTISLRRLSVVVAAKFPNKIKEIDKVRTISSTTKERIT